jgi:catechol 2,3-dioxygenase-like lactoylglutathione lyase family enzyme
MTSSKPALVRAVAFEGSQPILRVSDLNASVDYYVNVLGFKLDFRESIASVSRGRCALFLVEGDQGHPGGWVWVGVSDVDAVYDEYRASGARIRQPPTNFSWACEMQVEDPDGNVLRLGSEPKPNQPFGPWRDMRGDLWQRAPNGEWIRAR